MGLMFCKIHRGFISDFNITEENSMWLAGFRKKNRKCLLSKIFLVSKMTFEKAMSEKQPISFQKLKQMLNYWALLWLEFTNDWLFQKIRFNISRRNLWNIVKYLTHAVPICKKVKLMVKVWFFELIYQTFKAFTEAMVYTLFEVTIARLKFLHQNQYRLWYIPYLK